jgi:hypothetical protein
MSGSIQGGMGRQVSRRGGLSEGVSKRGYERQ